MNTPVAAALRCSLIFLVSAVAYADSAQWNLNPTSGDWNAATNWTPMIVPNGPADIATFALSNTTDVSISEDTEVSGITFTSAATNPYSITVSPGLTLTLSGTGIMDNSGIAQVLYCDWFGGERGQILFTNSASAGNADITSYGILQFSNSSTAGDSQILLEESSATFGDNSTAGHANIRQVFGFLSFFGNSTAGDAIIFQLPGQVIFNDSSTAGHASIVSGDDTCFVGFANTASAGTATLDAVEGVISFDDSSTAAGAGITVRGGELDFTGSSTGGTAEIELFFSDILQRSPILGISRHNFPGVTIGSIEGDDSSFALLGANNLTVGSNDLSTTFSGVIADNGFGGSLTKIGPGTLDLKGTNAYTGLTNINGGVLQIDGSISSNTFVNPGGTLAGSGTVNGSITNRGGRISPGDATGEPGVLTVGGNYTTLASQIAGATLSIQIGGVKVGQASVLDVQGNANLGGFLDPVLVNAFVPKVGQSFTFLNYASFTGFLRIRNPVFDHGRKRWLLTYTPTSAVLTAAQNQRP